MPRASLFLFFGILMGCQAQNAELFHLSQGRVSRSISFENRSGAPGQGGQAASHLGVGRKGSPAKRIRPGQSVTLCDIEGQGIIRHIWLTTENDDPRKFRNLIIRGYWDDQVHPSIECPLGDFFGFAHGKVKAYQSSAHSVGEKAGMNIWLPMPFKKRARFTLGNDHDQAIRIYYQIDYTLGDRHPDDFGRLHVLFRRENPTTMREDFELLPQRQGRGCFVGTVIGVRLLQQHWWGEGEMKVYMDGDGEFPTICGTGAEDYIGLSWGVQETPFMQHGCSLKEDGFVSCYRWHFKDPIFWEQECRITIQQIGNAKDKRIYETQDDWSCASFWYEPIPSQPLPAMPDSTLRTVALD